MGERLLTLLFLILMLTLFLSPLFPPVFSWDGGVYLASSYALRTQTNPWEENNLTRIAHDRGYYPDGARVLGLWTPVTVLVLYLPLTFLPAQIAIRLGILLNIFLVLLLVKMNRLWWLCLSTLQVMGLTLFFPPFIALLIWQQISGWVLLGFIGFIVFVQQKRDKLAGVFLVLTTFKPHIGFLALFFIAWWVWKNKRWQVVLGATVTLGVILILATLVYPMWIRDYVNTWQAPPMEYKASTLSYIIREKWFPNTPGMQFLPLGIACLMLTVRLMRGGIKEVFWLETIFFLLGVSIVVAPYGWIYDQVLIWPLYIWGLDRASLLPEAEKKVIYSGVIIFILVSIVQFVLTNFGNDSPQLFWQPFLWIGATFYVLKRLKTSTLDIL